MRGGLTKTLLVYTLVAMSAAVALVLLYVLVPAFRVGFSYQHQSMEDITSVVYLAGCAVGLLAVCKPGARGARLIHLPIIVLTLILFSEEEGFLKRALPFSLPVIWGVRIDGLHSLAVLAFSYLRYRHGLLVPVSIALGLVVIVLALKYGGRIRLVPAFLARYPAYTFAVLAVVFIAIALLADLGVVRGSLGGLLEELFELEAALALLFAAVVMVQPGAAKPTGATWDRPEEVCR